MSITLSAYGGVFECVFVWVNMFMWRTVWLTVEIDSSPGGPSVAHAHTHSHSGDMKVKFAHTHTLYFPTQLQSHFSPPLYPLSSLISLGIAVWSISTMTCVRAASSLGAQPRATSSTTPWWSTAHRWESSTGTHPNTHIHRHTHICFACDCTLQSSILMKADIFPLKDFGYYCSTFILIFSLNLLPCVEHLLMF